MTDLKLHTTASLRVSRELLPAEPLWKRVPVRDDEGRLLSDFLMIIPKLGQWPKREIQQAMASIESVLQHYRQVVMFADLNLRLNTLWVTVKPVPGICLELPAAIHARVPQARLVAQKHNRA